MTNMGNPIIEVVDANHANRGELLLVHRWEGHDLKLDEASEGFDPPEELRALIRTVLAKAPEDRFASAREMLVALDAIPIEGTASGAAQRSA